MSEHPVPGGLAKGPSGETPPDRAGHSTRASDADRDQVVDILRDQYTEGRLTLAEFTTRVSAASSARTWGELREQLSDLPVRLPFGDSPSASLAVPAPAGPDLELILLVVLLVVCPPAGIAYWFMCYRQSRSVANSAGLGERP
jgi:hypothetical protein